jgi:hypothetical protein
VRESGRQKESPLHNNKSKPDHKTRYHPDAGNSDEHGLPKKQAERQKQISDITHPEHVSELLDSPVVSCLRKEKDKREYAEHSKAKIRIFNWRQRLTSYDSSVFASVWISLAQVFSLE